MAERGIKAFSPKELTIYQHQMIERILEKGELNVPLGVRGDKEFSKAPPVIPERSYGKTPILPFPAVSEKERFDHGIIESLVKKGILEVIPGDVQLYASSHGGLPEYKTTTHYDEPLGKAKGRRRSDPAVVRISGDFVQAVLTAYPHVDAHSRYKK
ncbi:MAG: hypothetical protein AABX01_01135 [Candidatus Micrarchaeota archaeon]